MNPNSSPKITIDVITEARRWETEIPELAEVCRLAANAAFDACGAQIGWAEASIMLADNARLQLLNRAYRDIDEPTDVLSFPGLEIAGSFSPGTHIRPVLLGDIVVAYESAAAEAAAQGKELRNHLSHLVVHGMLHLLGYDHLKEVEANEMEHLEVRILEKLGISDPYVVDGLVS